MALAVSNGMSICDFCALSPNQFTLVAEMWREKEKASVMHKWNIARKICYTISFPRLKKKITELEYMPLPWDKEGNKEKVEKKTKAEIKADYKRIKKEYGVDG